MFCGFICSEFCFLYGNNGRKVLCELMYVGKCSVERSGIPGGYECALGGCDLRLGLDEGSGRDWWRV